MKLYNLEIYLLLGIEPDLWMSFLRFIRLVVEDRAGHSDKRFNSLIDKRTFKFTNIPASIPWYNLFHNDQAGCFLNIIERKVHASINIVNFSILKNLLIWLINVTTYLLHSLACDDLRKTDRSAASRGIGTMSMSVRNTQSVPQFLRATFRRRFCGYNSLFLHFNIY